jgi:hypothetical protein
MSKLRAPFRQAEVGAARTMLERTETRFSMKPAFLAADSAYGSAESLAWLVKQKTITPHIPVFDKSNRTDGTFSRADFVFNPERDRYTCPAGKELVQFRRTYAIPRSGVTAEGTRLYRASKLDCDVCKLKAQCCPNALARKIPRDLHEDARDVARAHAATPEYVEACRRRKKVEMLFAHLKRILRLTRLRLRGPNGARDEFLLAATAQNLRRLARLRPVNMLPEMLATQRRTVRPNSRPKDPGLFFSKSYTLPIRSEYLTAFSTVSANSGHCPTGWRRRKFDPKTSQAGGAAKKPRTLSRGSFRFRTLRSSPSDSVNLKPPLGSTSSLTTWRLSSRATIFATPSGNDRTN